MASNIIDVYVKLPTGRTCQFDLSGSDNIARVCDVIASQEAVDSGAVRLRYQGKYLDRNSTLSYLGVRPETILRAEILIPKDQDVLVQLPNGEETRYTVKNTDKILTLRLRLAKDHDKLLNKTKLMLKGTPIRGTTFVEAGISEGTVLYLSWNEEDDSSDEIKSKNKTSSKEEMKEEDLEAILTSFDTGGKNVEVVFSFDTTGSMYQYLKTVRSKLQQCCTRLIQDIPNIRIGLIAHGDYCDQNSSYVIKTLDMTSDVQSLVSFANTVPQTCGGDSPECYEWTLRKAQHMDWSEDSAKALIVIGDCEPHPPSYTDQALNWHCELDVLIGMGVKVYGVKAGNNEMPKAFYEELADRSGGCYLPLQHFDVIVDMFMAVCYRESNQDQFEAFVQEVEDGGQMTEAKERNV
ncbi:uncharacterized protein LOC121382130 [Gigantopelta aegis]|uniref:uncharacterized protein LOC121382130 n=1 Tax=Gigantopelta aegis TaxID=1735272 RepID=UPI001B887DCD|nr:uncharacterized protein LOC121382130 [Gigantopelta aegis]